MFYKKGTIEEKKLPPQFRAEFSMGQYDYERYHYLLMDADFMANQVLNNNLHAIQPFYAKLITLYSNFRPITFQTFRTKYDALRKECDDLFVHWKQHNFEKGRQGFPTTLANKLIEFWQELLVLKQMIGLGVMVSKEESQKTKLLRAGGLHD